MASCSLAPCDSRAPLVPRRAGVGPQVDLNLCRRGRPHWHTHVAAVGARVAVTQLLTGADAERRHEHDEHPQRPEYPDGPQGALVAEKCWLNGPGRP